MLFIVSWKAGPESRSSRIDRFLTTGGAPPDGVKMLGRWHAIGRDSGVAIAETNDPVLLQKWALNWTDLMQMDICPALTDEQAGPLLAAVSKK